MKFFLESNPKKNFENISERRVETIKTDFELKEQIESTALSRFRRATAWALSYGNKVEDYDTIIRDIEFYMYTEKDLFLSTINSLQALQDVCKSAKEKYLSGLRARNTIRIRDLELPGGEMGPHGELGSGGEMEFRDRDKSSSSGTMQYINNVPNDEEEKEPELKTLQDLIEFIDRTRTKKTTVNIQQNTGESKVTIEDLLDFIKQHSDIKDDEEVVDVTVEEELEKEITPEDIITENQPKKVQIKMIRKRTNDDNKKKKIVHKRDVSNLNEEQKNNIRQLIVSKAKEDYNLTKRR